MRRSAGFEIADHIFIYYKGDDYLKGIMVNTGLADYIKQETLADDLVPRAPAEGAYSENFKLEGHEVKLGVLRV